MPSDEVLLFSSYALDDSMAEREAALARSRKRRSRAQRAKGERSQ
jgi:hypothetical protein